jgi:hypothetical protein
MGFELVSIAVDHLVDACSYGCAIPEDTSNRQGISKQMPGYQPQKTMDVVSNNGMSVLNKCSRLHQNIWQEVNVQVRVWRGVNQR